MHHASLNTRRVTRAGRLFSYHRCSAWPWVWVHALGFYASYRNEVLEVVSFGSQTHVVPNTYVVCCASKLCWGKFKKPHLETSLSSNIPHHWVSSAIPDICRYINSNWDTATSLHICYDSLFSLLSYNSTSFYQIIATDKSVRIFCSCFVQYAPCWIPFETDVSLSGSYWFFKKRHPTHCVIYSTESATLYVWMWHCVMSVWFQVFRRN